MAKTGSYAQNYNINRRVLRWAARDSQESQAMFGDGIAPPSGRAPRGSGAEYADRRWIDNAITTQDNYLSKVRASLQTSRGEKNRRWQRSYETQRIQILEDAISQARTFAQSEADWGFKREVVKEILDYGRAQTSMLK